jgi:putative DNA methylase
MGKLESEGQYIMNKVLIEEASTELLELFDLVSEEAKKEKNAVPPINKMLYWWTRKPLIVGRAIALTSTLRDIKDVKELLGLEREKRAYTYTPNLGTYKKKLGKDPSEINVADPFGGAGNLMLEANRLGLNCHAIDYNPVAYLIMKATLEYPPKYGIKLARDVQKYGEELIKKTKKEIEEFFNANGKKTLAYIWVWCITCPYCQQRIPLTNHMWLAKTRNKRIGFTVNPTDNHEFIVKLRQTISEVDGKFFTQKGGKAICIRCRNTIGNDQMSKSISANKDREIIAVVVHGMKGKEYRLPTKDDIQSFNKASEYLQRSRKLYEKENLIPYEEIKANRGGDISQYGIRTWSQFFSERQLLVMLTIVKNIKLISRDIADREYAKVISTYLSLILCKHILRNSIGTVWDVTRETISHALSFRVPRLNYNHSEVNPFEKISGSLKGMLDDLTEGIEIACSAKKPCDVQLNSVLGLSSNHKKEFDLIITDPPYMDDVPYAEVSDFFHLWMFRVLKDYYPEIPSTSPVEEDISLSRTRFGNMQLAFDFYRKAMEAAFKQIHDSLKDDGLLVLFFAHSSVAAWNLLIECIRESKFYVVSSYSIHTEMGSGVLASGKTSFMSSIVVVCRKLIQDSAVYFEDIIPVVEDKIKEMLDNISAQKLLSIPLTDLLIMMYGKVLEATTNHTELKSYRKNFKPEFESLISDSRDFILRQIVTKLTGRTINLLGSQMSFYLLTKIFYRGILAGDDLLKVTRTYGLEKEQIEKDKIGKNEDGRIRLFYLYENEIEKKPEEIDIKNTHQQLCYLAQIVDTKGAVKLKPVLSYSNFRMEDLKQVVSVLLKSFRLRINKKEHLGPKEQKEVKILETLADILGMKSEDSIDSYM